MSHFIYFHLLSSAKKGPPSNSPPRSQLRFQPARHQLLSLRRLEDWEQQAKHPGIAIHWLAGVIV